MKHLFFKWRASDIPEIPKPNKKNFIRKNEINSYKANPKLAKKIIKWKNRLKLKEIVAKMVNEELF